MHCIAVAAPQGKAVLGILPGKIRQITRQQILHGDRGGGQRQLQMRVLHKLPRQISAVLQDHLCMGVDLSLIHI